MSDEEMPVLEEEEEEEENEKEEEKEKKGKKEKEEEKKKDEKKEKKETNDEKKGKEKKVENKEKDGKVEFVPDDFEKMDGHYEYDFKDAVKKRHERVPNNKEYSSPFTIKGYEWRLLVMPNGSSGHDPEHMSVFLESLGPRPPGWHRHSKFSIGVKNHLNSKDSISSTSTHNFFDKVHDRGFSTFFQAKTLLNPARGFLKEDGSITIVIGSKIIRDHKDRPFPPLAGQYDPKRELDKLGIKNRGSTDRVNALLQVYHHLLFLRNSLFQVSEPSDNLDTLQFLFYRLVRSSVTASAKHVLQALHLDDYEKLVSSSVSEVNSSLLNWIEGGLKETPMNEMVDSLFRGELVGEDEKQPASRFHELPLKVGAGKTIYDSLDFYCNKWKERKAFLSLPPVLCVSLGRDQVKSTEKFFCEYYSELDLGRYFANEKKEARETKYHLFAVICHGGGAITGHYSSYIRQECKGEWLHFNDDLVVRVEDSEAMSTNFGPPVGSKYVSDRYTNLLTVSKKYIHAVMLFYVQESQLQKVFGGEWGDISIAPHIRKKIEKEENEAKLKISEKEHAHLFMDIKVVTQEHLFQHNQEKCGLVDFRAISPSKVNKNETLDHHLRRFAEVNRMESDMLRAWVWATRKNKTIRPDKLHRYEADYPSTLGCMEREPMEDLKFFIEVSDEEGPPYFPPFDPRSIMIFLKYFDVESGVMTYLRFIHVRQCDTIRSVFKDLEDLLHHPDLRIYEEVSPKSITLVNVDQTFQEEGISSGDILVVEKVYPDHSKFPFLSCPQWYKKMERHKEVTFLSQDRPDTWFSEELSLDLSYQNTMYWLAKKVGGEEEKAKGEGKLLVWRRCSFGGEISRCREATHPTLGDMLGGGRCLYFSYQNEGGGGEGE